MILKIRNISRVSFTGEDERHLVDYIATKIPAKEAGGRFSVNFYQELIDSVSRYTSLRLYEELMRRSSRLKQTLKAQAGPLATPQKAGKSTTRRTP